MQDILRTLIKFIAHIALYVFMLFNFDFITTQKDSKYILTIIPRIILLILSVIESFYIFFKIRQYQHRYSKKRYKMPKTMCLTFTILETILLISMYMLTFYNLFGIGLFIVFAIHFVLVLGLNLFNIRVDKVLLKKSLNKYPIEHGEIRGRVIVDGNVVLEAGEKVQVLENFNHNILIRKATGDEYTINMEMIEMRQ